MVAAKSHVLKAERNNRVIKERIRCAYHNLNYKNVPKTVLIYMVQKSANKLNYFPARDGVSPAYSPHMIIHKRNIDYVTHGLHYTGKYILGHQDVTIKNNLQPRALDCIYLRPSAIIHDKHELYHIETRKIITRRHCTSAIMNENIKTKIHKTFITDNLPTGLKFHLDNTDNLTGYGNKRN